MSDTTLLLLAMLGTPIALVLFLAIVAFGLYMLGVFDGK